MTSCDRGLTIIEFLLGYVSSEPYGWAEGPERTATLVQDVVIGSESRHAAIVPAEFGYEVLRHRDRTMTIVSIGGVEATTRCGVCPKSAVPPCDGLRLLALPFAEHPAYRPEWRIDRPTSFPLAGQPTSEIARYWRSPG